MRLVGKALGFPAYFTVALDLGFNAQPKSSPTMACPTERSTDSHFYGSLKTFFGLTSKYCLVPPAKLLYLYVSVD